MCAHLRMKFISAEKVICIPTDVAVCPDCLSPLTAVPASYEQFFPAVNLFLPRSTQRISCEMNDNHGKEMDDGWFKVYDSVARWFEGEPVAFEFGPELTELL